MNSGRISLRMLNEQSRTGILPACEHLHGRDARAPLKLPWFKDNAFPLYLAPMARYTDTVYRQLCKRHGADVMVTEFVMADSLLYGGADAWRTVDFTDGQRPMGVQIFGSSAERMAKAARLIEERMRPDFIDINCGCPADRVTDQNAGSSLLRDPAQLARIAETVIQAIPATPVTVKIRLGWDAQSIVALEVGRRLQDVGIQALTVHGRTKEQGYSGEACWQSINEVAAALEIPVVGNGDIRCCEDVKRIRETSPVAGVMIGRGALGYPWIFGEIKHYLRHGTIPPPPPASIRWQTMLDYARLLLEGPFQHKSPDDIRWMRPRLKALTKDMKGGKKLRLAIDTLSSLSGLETLAREQIEISG